ncbi:MAG: response regulator [Ferruginibacter sp.]
MDKPITILYADDDSDDRALFCKAIEEVDPDIKCHTMEDGYMTLKYLKDEANTLPDYIFLDLRMPRMSGKKCLEEIRADERLKKIAVIIYTTSDDVEDSKNLAELGATHFVTKPTNPEEIYYLISMVLTEKWT